VSFNGSSGRLLAVSVSVSVGISANGGIVQGIVEMEDTRIGEEWAMVLKEDRWKEDQ
jgi:hypothetical protein